MQLPVMKILFEDARPLARSDRELFYRWGRRALYAAERFKSSVTSKVHKTKAAASI
jgi:hypothetical protein